MNNLRLFTNEKQIDTQASSSLRKVLSKISLKKMNESTYEFCQYVFLSYVHGLDQAAKTEDFAEKEESVIKVNTTAHVFDQELLTNVLRYLKWIQSNVDLKPSAEKNLAAALLKHSKKFEHKNMSEEKVNLLTF